MGCEKYGLNETTPVVVHMAAMDRRIEELERVESAARNLVKVKGRHHSEQAYQRLVAALEALSEDQKNG
jgi:hypothetical protein